MDTTESRSQEDRKPTVSFTTDPVKVRILSEPSVLLTARGYAPVVQVRVEGDKEERMMYISAASLAQSLEPLRQQNNNRFTGLELKVSKESSDRFAKYVVEPA